jgi:hypothetical protein
MLVKNFKPSLYTGGLATAPPSGNNKSKAKAKCTHNGPNHKAATPGTSIYAPFFYICGISFISCGLIP